MSSDAKAKNVETAGKPGPAVSGDDALAREAQGIAVMLLAAVGVALAMGYVVHRLHAGPYIPIVIPGLCGAAFGGLIALVRGRFEVRSMMAALGACALAAFVFVAAFQALIYLRSVDLVASKLDPANRELLGSWWGFLTWTSTTPEGANLSPLGVLGRLSVTPVMVAAVIVVELLVAFGAARWALLRRGIAGAPGHLRTGSSAAVVVERTKRQLLGGNLDTEALLLGLKALDSSDIELAARHLGQACSDGTHRIYLSWAPHSGAPWLLEVVEIAGGSAGAETVTASREVSSWDGQLLLDEVRAGASQ